MIKRRSVPFSSGVTLAVLASAGFVASFMQTILIPIQSQLPELLGAEPSDTSWAITVTLLAGAVANPIAGRIGDMFGKRRIMLLLLSVLIAGSLVAGFAYSVPVLVVGRALQGIGMAAIPVGIAILRDELPADRLVSAVALMSATLVIGGSLGLPISALVAQFFEWHMLFFFSAGAAAVCFVLVLWVVPPSARPSGGRVDYVGAIMLSLGLIAVLLAASKGSEWGWGSRGVIGLGIGGAAVLLGWGWHQLRVSSPIVDLRSSARGPVLMTNLASVAMGFALFTTSITFPQLLIQPISVGGMGLSLIMAGLVLAPAGIVTLAMTPLVGMLGRRLGTKFLFISGSVVIAIGYLLASTMPLGVGWIMVINMVNGIGVSLGYAAMPTLIMRSVPASQAGAANGLNTLMRGIGTSTGAAITGAILAGSISIAGGYPSMAGYQVAFLCGLGAAIVSACLAAVIPRSVVLEDSSELSHKAVH